MLPEDATRCILNNEKAFFNEFSERASAVGLSDTQIAEAFEAMKNGDYAKMATYFDTSSPVDGAVFWSGNKEGAAAYANSIGGLWVGKYLTIGEDWVACILNGIDPRI